MHKLQFDARFAIEIYFFVACIVLSNLLLFLCGFQIRVFQIVGARGLWISVFFDLIGSEHVDFIFCCNLLVIVCAGLKFVVALRLLLLLLLLLFRRMLDFKALHFSMFVFQSAESRCWNDLNYVLICCALLVFRCVVCFLCISVF